MNKDIAECHRAAVLQLTTDRDSDLDWDNTPGNSNTQVTQTLNYNSTRIWHRLVACPQRVHFYDIAYWKGFPRIQSPVVKFSTSFSSC